MSCGTCGESRHSKGCENCAHGTVVCGGCGTTYLIPVAPPVVEQAVDFDGNVKQDFVVLSRRKVRIERADLCEDCQRKRDLIAGGIIFGVDYPCEDCRRRIVARETARCPVSWCGVESKEVARPCTLAGATECWRPAFGPLRYRCFCSYACRVVAEKAWSGWPGA